MYKKNRIGFLVMQEEKQEKQTKDKLLQKIRGRLQYLIDTRHDGNKAEMGRFLNVGSGQVNDWFNIDKRTKPGPKYEPLILEKYGITRAWLYGEEPLNKFNEEKIEEYTRNTPERFETQETKLSDIAVYGTIKVTVEQYMELIKENATLKERSANLRQANEEKSRQIDLLAETFRDSIHIMNSIVENEHTPKNTHQGETTGQHIETEIGKSHKSGNYVPVRPQ